MTCCCDSQYGFNPHTGTDLKSNVWNTVDTRQRVISCISASLCPVTCPIWSIWSCVVNITSLATCCFCCCTCCWQKMDDSCGCALEPCGASAYSFFLCYPPYENKCTLLFCSLFYPFHAREGGKEFPCFLRCDDLGISCCGIGYGVAQPFALADYATGPERQLMDWPNLAERRQARGIGATVDRLGMFSAYRQDHYIGVMDSIPSVNREYPSILLSSSDDESEDLSKKKANESTGQRTPLTF